MNDSDLIYFVLNSKKRKGVFALKVRSFIEKNERSCNNNLIKPDIEGSKNECTCKIENADQLTIHID